MGKCSYYHCAAILTALFVSFLCCWGTKWISGIFEKFLLLLLSSKRYFLLKSQLWQKESVEEEVLRYWHSELSRCEPCEIWKDPIFHLNVDKHSRTDLTSNVSFQICGMFQPISQYNNLRDVLRKGPISLPHLHIDNIWTGLLRGSYNVFELIFHHSINAGSTSLAGHRPVCSHLCLSIFFTYILDEYWVCFLL